MAYRLNFSKSSDSDIERSLCQTLEQLRLSRNMTQTRLAESAGVSLRTVQRMEKGHGVSLSTFIRAMMALGVQNRLATLLPDLEVQPQTSLSSKNQIRKRARPEVQPELRSGKQVRKQNPWGWNNDSE